MMATVAIIPARFASTRFPGKPLANDTGKYLIQHVYERVAEGRRIDRTIVATDDERIAVAVKSFGGEVRMTRTDHATGTDRIALVGEAAGWISPSSAEGFSYAFKSAIHLAKALKKSLKHFQTHYHRNSTSLRRNMFMKNLKSHIIYNPRLRKTVMKVGIGTMKLHHPKNNPPT